MTFSTIESLKYFERSNIHVVNVFMLFSLDNEFVIERTTHPMGREGLSKVQEVDELFMSKYQVRFIPYHHFSLYCINGVDK